MDLDSTRIGSTRVDNTRLHGTRVDNPLPGGGELAAVIEFPLWRRRFTGPPSILPIGGATDDGLNDVWDDQADDQAPSDAPADASDARRADAHAERSACMAELVAMLAAEGADVVAFARSVPPRFRGRLPADLRLAAGVG